MICKNCGKEIIENEQCKYCGYKPEDDYKYGPKSKYYEDLWKLNEAYKENIQLNRRNFQRDCQYI